MLYELIACFRSFTLTLVLYYTIHIIIHRYVVRVQRASYRLFHILGVSMGILSSQTASHTMRTNQIPDDIKTNTQKYMFYMYIWMQHELFKLSASSSSSFSEYFSSLSLAHFVIDDSHIHNFPKWRTNNWRVQMPMIETLFSKISTHLPMWHLYPHSELFNNCRSRLISPLRPEHTEKVII